MNVQQRKGNLFEQFQKETILCLQIRQAVAEAMDSLVLSHEKISTIF